MMPGRVREAIARGRRAWRQFADFKVRGALLPWQVSHVHGPASITYGPDELIVISVVRNGAVYVAPFVEHHQRLGVAHIVVLDNGSTDDTIDRFRGYAGVTVLRTRAPYARYENTMKRYLAERFSAGRWNLCADIDEHFDYPWSERLPLRQFMRYLNTRGFSAVVAQMLDLFPSGPLTRQSEDSDRAFTSHHVYYDTSAIDRRPYEWGQASSDDVRMHWGGIRRSVFGTDNGLTKAALVLMNGRVTPFINWHHATGAIVADVTGVLRHYPFLSGFREKVLDAVATRRYGRTTTGEYQAYAAALAEADVTLMKPTARRYAGLQPLLDDRFLIASEPYRQWVRDHGWVPAGTPSTHPVL